MSEKLTKSLAKGKLIIRKRRHISGEVLVRVADRLFTLSNFNELDVSSFVTSQNVGYSNIKKLLAKDKIEIV